MMYLEWVSVEEQMSTASISGSFRMSFASLVVFGMPQDLAKASVCSFMNGSAMVLISISGTNIEMFFACTLPMRPAPIMPTFIYFLSSFIQ